MVLDRLDMLVVELLIDVLDVLVMELLADVLDVLVLLVEVLVAEVLDVLVLVKETLESCLMCLKCQNFDCLVRRCLISHGQSAWWAGRFILVLVECGCSLCSWW